MEDGKDRRRRPGNLCLLLLTASVFLLPPWAAAQKAKQNRPKPVTPPTAATDAPADNRSETTTKAGAQELRVLYEHAERTKGHIIASGNVEVHYGSLVLFADTVDLQTDTKDVRADGRVVLQSENEVTTADSLTFNLDTALGRMEHAVGLAQPSLFFEAGVLDRQEPDYYHFEGARFTTCAQPNPRWKFSCSKANYKKDDYVEMWNMVLSIKGIPVFYFPYFRYPIQDRATGLLRPNIGYTKTKGWKISQDFYLVLARNLDITLNVMYYSAVGTGGNFEFRYLLPEGTGGRIGLSKFFFKPLASGFQPASASIVRVSHNQQLPLGFSLVADVDLQSSYAFLREFDNNFNRATISNRRSQVYLSNSFSGFNFSARASRFETNFAALNNSIITEYLPQISLSSFKLKLVKPLYFSFNSSFSRWQYGWQTDFDKDNQKKLQFLNFSPTLSLPVNPFPWLTVTTSMAGNLNYYWQSLVPYALNPNRMVAADSPLFTKNVTFVFDLRGPTFFRVFNDSEGNPSVKHIIEPSVTYRYDSPVADSERIITANGFFRFHMVTYGLTSHLLVKEDKMPREWVTLGLSQTYYLDAADSPNNRYRWHNRIPNVSDINAYLRVLPSNKYSLDFSANYNPYFNIISSIRLGARLGGPMDDVFLNVNWFKSISPWNYEVFWNRHQVNFFGGFKLPGLNLEGQGEVDYNISRKELLYAAASLVYHYQCVDFDADIRVFNFRQQRDVQYSFSIGLGNIGKSMDFLGGMGF
jgi:LPS-assembly protein